ncbi:LysR family transcriptional regulator [Bordetella sp. FB-8]|uniref:LysR family transcriptional regulator n=1 Tax=Bordetella sp. FB-8 TaxID=1159870 RepID=UPI00037A5244|nr:LysR family transcriptional regulator [Bordetella sp. FB-8]
MQIAVSVAELGSLQKAAQVLRLSQPAATKAIADLETQLGMPLFERHARGMRPTRAGYEIIPFIRRVIDDTRSCAERAIHHRLGATSTLRIASVGAGISGLLASALGKFNLQYPDIAVEVHEIDVYGVAKLTAEDGADLIICRHPGEIAQGHVFEALLDDTHVLVAPRNHALAGARNITLEQLAGFTWLLPPGGVPARGIFESLWSDAGMAQPHLCTMQTRSPLLTASLVNQLGLIAIVPFTIARPSFESGNLIELGFKGLGGIGPMGALWRSANMAACVAPMLEVLRGGDGSTRLRPV